jgi:hypothetical protein
MRTMISAGLIRARSSHPSPHDSSVPGRKFSTRTSAVLASSRAIRRPFSDFRFRVSDFLLRLCEYHQSDVPLCSLRQRRSGSPSPGASILIN